MVCLHHLGLQNGSLKSQDQPNNIGAELKEEGVNKDHLN